MIRLALWNVLKWLGLLLELYFLFVFVNAAFLLPYPNDWKRVLFATISALLAGVFAFFSSLGWVKMSASAGTQRRVLFGVPSVFWALVIATSSAVLFVHAVFL